ncbi:hypothetical protein PLESTM_001460700 [Pleodorina starrii]|nr:hypothetical protein PLESTM_001460700 [Pleodorina starrii]
MHTCMRMDARAHPEAAPSSAPKFAAHASGNTTGALLPSMGVIPQEAFLPPPPLQSALLPADTTVTSKHRRSHSAGAKTKFEGPGAAVTPAHSPEPMQPL